MYVHTAKVWEQKCDLYSHDLMYLLAMVLYAEQIIIRTLTPHNFKIKSQQVPEFSGSFSALKKLWKQKVSCTRKKCGFITDNHHELLDDYEKWLQGPLKREWLSFLTGLIFGYLMSFYIWWPALHLWRLIRK